MLNEERPMKDVSVTTCSMKRCYEKVSATVWLMKRDDGSQLANVQSLSSFCIVMCVSVAADTCLTWHCLATNTFHYSGFSAVKSQYQV